MSFERFRKMVGYAEKLLLLTPFFFIILYYLPHVRKVVCVTHGACIFYFQNLFLGEGLRFGMLLVFFFLCRRRLSSANEFLNLMTTAVGVVLFVELFVFVALIFQVERDFLRRQSTDSIARRRAREGGFCQRGGATGACTRLARTICRSVAASHARRWQVCLHECIACRWTRRHHRQTAIHPGTNPAAPAPP